MVRATFAGFSTALSALQSNQKRLDIIGHNLSNMNTVGYTRQELQTSSVNYTSPVSTFMNGSEVIVGFGVHMDKVAQIRDPYLDAQYRSQMEKSGYTDSVQTSLDSLAKIFDETSINGIHQAFVDIQTALNDMQDVAKINDSVYESELRSRFKTLTNLLNQASKDIDEAEKQEFDRLVGETSTQNGAQEQVNDLLRQIGELNQQIKRNQILGQQSLELMDERNTLIDELSSYLPIEVTYYKDQAHDGKGANGADAPEEVYYLDKNGNPIAKKEWPDDVRIELVYKNNGTEERITLVEGSEGSRGENYGSIKFETDSNDPDNPTTVSLTVTSSAKDLVNNKAAQNIKFEKPDANADTTTSGNRIYDGSIQGSLHMLWQDGTIKDLEKDHTSVNGYEFYRNQLDELARSFAYVMNEINIYGTSTDKTALKTDQFLLVNKETGNYTSGSTPDTNITAANIGINTDWSNGTVHISMASKDPNQTVLDMIEALNSSYPNTNKNIAGIGSAGNPPTGGVGSIDLKNNSFADYMNYTSTYLANDSYHNSLSLKTNVTVLNGIQNSRDSVSGVSLDEEASNMMQYMSAYNAASRIMTALDQALDVLINSTGMVGR